MGSPWFQQNLAEFLTLPPPLNYCPSCGHDLTMLTVSNYCPNCRYHLITHNIGTVAHPQSPCRAVPAGTGFPWAEATWSESSWQPPQPYVFLESTPVQLPIAEPAHYAVNENELQYQYGSTAAPEQPPGTASERADRGFESVLPTLLSAQVAAQSAGTASPNSHLTASPSPPAAIEAHEEESRLVSISHDPTAMRPR